MSKKPEQYIHFPSPTHNLNQTSYLPLPSPQQHQPFISYLKQQHQQSIQTIQHLQNKIQILQKSIQHLQSRIKLKDTQIQEKQQEIANKNVEIEDMKGVNGKYKALKKQVGKLSEENRELAELLENQRQILSNYLRQEQERSKMRIVDTEQEQEKQIERERNKIKQRSREKQVNRYITKNKQNQGLRKRTGRVNIDLQTQIDDLTNKNCQLQLQISYLQSQLVSKPSPPNHPNHFQKQQLFTLVSKLHQQQQLKTTQIQQLKLQHTRLYKQNILIKQQLLNHQQHQLPSLGDSDNSSFRRQMRQIREYTPNSYNNQKVNTLSSNNRNNSKVIERRRVGSIRGKGSNSNYDDSKLDQSSIYQARGKQETINNYQYQNQGGNKHKHSQNKRIGHNRRESQRVTEKEKERERESNIKRQQQNKKQHLLEALVARFQKLKISSFTNTAM